MTDDPERKPASGQTTLPDMLTFLNGTPIGPFDPAIGITDAGFTIGEGVFETMIAEGSKIVRLDRHKARMAEGCATLGLPPAKWSEVDHAVKAFLHRTPARRLSVRFTQTRGPLEGGFGSAAIGPATSVVAVRKAAPRASALTAALIDWPRRNPNGISTRFKCLGYGNEMVARAKAVSLGANIAILLSSDGLVSCADSANLFVRIKDRLVTPSTECGPLCGTVRAEILESASQSDLDVRTGKVTVSDLEDADELFATNAGFGICAISKVVNLRTNYRKSHEEDASFLRKTYLKT